MHWSTDVYHAPEFTYSNVHILPKTSHLWILNGVSCGSGAISFSLHKDQDQMNIHSLSAAGRYISNLVVNNDQVQVRHKFFSSNPSDKKKAGFLSYVRVIFILYILLFSTRIRIYWQRGEEID